MEWELREVGDIDCTIDDSGLYVVVDRVPRGCTVEVRADLMTDATKCSHLKTDEPVVSFIGSANNVRKHLIGFIAQNYGYAAISSEHASYIGYELHRAEVTENYVQD
jgi:hypothetical protein